MPVLMAAKRTPGVVDPAVQAHWREFGAWVKAHRKDAGLNETEAAIRSGLTLTHWSRLENGESGTRRNTIPRIAMAVDAPLTEAYRRAGFVPPYEAHVAEKERQTREEANRGGSLRLDAGEGISPALADLVRQAAYQGGRDGALEVVRELARIRERLDSFFATLPVSLSDLASAVEPAEDGG